MTTGDEWCGLCEMILTNDIAAAAAEFAREVLPDTVNVYQEGTGETIERPALLVGVDDVQEHSVMRGNFDLVLTFELQTIPEDTSLTAHNELAWALENQLERPNALGAKLAEASALVHDVRQISSVYGEEQDLRTFTGGLRVRVARVDAGAAAAALVASTPPPGFGDLTAEDPGSNLIPFYEAGAWKATTAALIHGANDVEWTTPTLLNGWINELGFLGYQPTRYCKKGGVVYIEGRVKTGSGVIFQLPAGCRPDNKIIRAADVTHEIIIDDTGDITNTGGTIGVNLGCSFYVG